MTTDTILTAVSRAYDVPVEHILNMSNRDRHVSRARHACWVLMREFMPEYTATRIAVMFGCDHTSVLYAWRTFRWTPLFGVARSKLNAVRLLALIGDRRVIEDDEVIVC